MRFMGLMIAVGLMLSTTAETAWAKK